MKRFLLFATGLSLALLLFVSPALISAETTDSHDTTLHYLADSLKTHLEQVHDISAQVTLTQFSKRDGSQNLGTLSLEAIFPDLVKATWRSPEIYSGVFFILDTNKNTYTEYLPAMGEAHLLPLDQVLQEQTVLEFAPDQLFALPSAEDYHVVIVETDDDTPDHYVIVEATEKIERAHTFTFWVDTDRWLITRIQETNDQGQVIRLAEATDIVVNQNLQAGNLRRLPPGTVTRAYP